MEASIETIIISLFFGILFILKWNVGKRIENRFKIDMFETKWMTVFRCLPCFCFWISFPIGYISFTFGIPDFISAITATFIVAFFIDKV